jgi:hypothetical protein
VPSSQLQNDEIKGSIQDGSREFISLLAAVSAIGERMAPSLIYSSKSGDLQDTWLNGFNEEDVSKSAYFTASQKGWTNNNLGVAWLHRFQQETGPKASKQRRLLIIDGHDSHVDLEFIELAISFDIYIAVFPPHSTHRLQPLDVSVFSPLASAYSRNLDNYIYDAGGYSSMSKRLFWTLFWPSWDKAVSKSNIESGFRKTGIFPFNPEVVLSQLAIKSKTSFYQSHNLAITKRSKPVSLRFAN